MNYLPLSCTERDIRMASDRVLIDSYSNAPFDYNEKVYDAIAEELLNRNLLEDID